jgi:hypothetical protein
LKCHELLETQLPMWIASAQEVIPAKSARFYGFILPAPVSLPDLQAQNVQAVMDVRAARRITVIAVFLVVPAPH